MAARLLPAPPPHPPPPPQTSSVEATAPSRPPLSPSPLQRRRPPAAPPPRAAQGGCVDGASWFPRALDAPLCRPPRVPCSDHGWTRCRRQMRRKSRTPLPCTTTLTHHHCTCGPRPSPPAISMGTSPLSQSRTTCSSMAWPKSWCRCFYLCCNMASGPPRRRRCGTVYKPSFYTALAITT